jgi:hypothetical protein
MNTLSDSFFRGTPGVDENTIIDQLEELIKSFGVQIRHEPTKNI